MKLWEKIMEQHLKNYMFPITIFGFTTRSIIEVIFLLTQLDKKFREKRFAYSIWFSLIYRKFMKNILKQLISPRLKRKMVSHKYDEIIQYVYVMIEKL